MKCPLLYSFIRGRIGNRFVIKHYGQKIVVTKIPDMSGIIGSPQQRQQRNLFKEAVAYAKAIIADPVRKKAWQRKLKRKNGVYNAAIKAFLSTVRDEKEKAMMQAAYLINKSFNRIPVKEIENLLCIHDGATIREWPMASSSMVVTAEPFPSLVLTTHKLSSQPTKIKA